MDIETLACACVRGYVYHGRQIGRYGVPLACACVRGLSVQLFKNEKLNGPSRACVRRLISTIVEKLRSTSAVPLVRARVEARISPIGENVTIPPRACARGGSINSSNITIDSIVSPRACARGGSGINHYNIMIDSVSPRACARGGSTLTNSVYGVYRFPSRVRVRRLFRHGGKPQPIPLACAREAPT
jgi:hypothetical protein